MARRETTDVLVLGGGMAGLCAALTAAEQGARVLLLEKGARFGGSMFLSNGIVWTYATEADARRRVPDADPALQALLVANLRSGMDWLEARGVALEAERVYLECGRGRAASGPQMTAALVARIREREGTLLSATHLARLALDDAGVTGALAIGPDGPVQVSARAVILATGGFQGNAELLARYVSPHAAAMYLRGNPWSTGDGLLAALDAGAATTASLDTFYGHALTAPPARFNAFGFQEMSHKYGPLAVALNLQGRRFTDESAGTGEEWLNSQIARQPQATAVYVFDAAVAEREYEGGALARVVLQRAREAGGPVAHADTLEALAEQRCDRRRARRSAVTAAARQPSWRRAAAVQRGVRALGDHVHVRRAAHRSRHARAAARRVGVHAAAGHRAGRGAAGERDRKPVCGGVRCWRLQHQRLHGRSRSSPRQRPHCRRSGSGLNAGAGVLSRLTAFPASRR
jgi:hypothetical protein